MKKIYLVLALLSSGCATVGPVVSRVHVRDDGTIVVRECDLEVGYNGFTTTAELENCKTHRYQQ